MLCPGNGEVILNIPFGVHDGHGFRPRATDHIGKAAHAGHSDLVEIRVFLLLLGCPIKDPDQSMISLSTLLSVLAF